MAEALKSVLFDVQVRLMFQPISLDWRAVLELDKPKLSCVGLGSGLNMKYNILVFGFGLTTESFLCRT